MLNKYLLNEPKFAKVSVVYQLRCLENACGTAHANITSELDFHAWAMEDQTQLQDKPAGLYECLSEHRQNLDLFNFLLTVQAELPYSRHHLD